MLAIVDRAFLISVPLLIVCVAFGFPDLAWTWVVIGGAASMTMLYYAIQGRRGRAPHRGRIYAVVMLLLSVGVMWTIGPFTAVGVLFGVTIMFAGAFLTRAGLFAAMAVAAGSIAIRSVIGGTVGLPGAVDGTYVVTFAMWSAGAFASGILLWMAHRVLVTLITTLERAYVSTKEAYRLELQTKQELDDSRQELEELAQAEMVGRLAGGVAHDVNNALTSVLAAAEVLATEVSTPDQRRHLAELEAASHHAADLVRDLLWTGRRFPNPRTMVASLDEIMRVCLERVGRVARRLETTVHVERRMVVAIPPEHLEQTLFGLLVGAHRAGVTQLGVTSTRRDATLELVLAGSRADVVGNARAIQVQLSVRAARELVGNYGGALSVREEPSELELRLVVPLTPIQLDVTPVAPVPTRTALIVEDEPMVLRRLCQLVSRRGYEVTAAATVAEGMDRLASDPDVLITDLQLPDGTGESIALASYEQKPTRPIIVCSGFSADDVRRGVLRAAPLTFLAKPFTAAELDNALARIGVIAARVA
ncbi:MAG TPA: response regulator [Kofleriaceae bacterium]